MSFRRVELRALSLIEVIIGFFVMAAAGAVLFTNLNSSYRYAGMTRSRTAATLLAANFVEEIKAHNYGEKAPKSWPKVSDESAPPSDWDKGYEPEDTNYERLEMLVAGRPVEMVFYRHLTLANGSFVDEAKTSKTDRVSLTLWWREAGLQGEKGFKSLQIELGVRSPW